MNITLADAMGYIAAVLVFTTFWMKTMVPLRLAGIGSNVCFIAYGPLAVAYPVLILRVCLLPHNLWRLRATQPVVIHSSVEITVMLFLSQE